MNPKLLMNLSDDTVETMYRQGAMTRFEYMFRKLLLNEIAWPSYEPEDLVQLRKRYDLTQEALALLLGVTVKTVNGWETKSKTLPPLANIVLCTFDRLGPSMFDLMTASRRDIFKLQKVPYSGKANEGKRAKKTQSRNSKEKLPPVTFDAKEVVALRMLMRLTRPAFAEKMDVSLSTIDKWEQGKVTPRGPALKLLQQLWVYAHS